MDTPARSPVYSPFLAGPFRWRLGLRPLDLARWIEIDDDYDSDLAVKAAMQQKHPDTVFAALPTAVTTAACQEVLDGLVKHLTGRRPDDFRLEADTIVNRRTGDTLATRGGRHPLEVASRLVQEDLVVMTREDPAGGEVFAAGSICFPNRWDLRSKLGRSMRTVHEPVDLLNEQLADPIDRFFARLTPDKSFWRLGWGVLDSDDLYQPLDGSAAPRPAQPTVDDLVVRVERETLRRFPVTGAVLFTIRTYRRRLLDVVVDPDERDRLTAALAALPPGVRDYKQLDVIDAALTVALGEH